MVHHYVPTIHPFHQHFVNFPTPRHCHTCSESSHITAFGCSCPPCHPHSGVTPLQHWHQRPFFWEAGTLIGGPPPLPSYPQQRFTCVHMPTSISGQIVLHLDLPVHCKQYNSELGNSNYYTTFSVSKGVIQRKKESRSSVTSSPNDKQIDPALWLWQFKQG